MKIKLRGVYSKRAKLKSGQVVEYFYHRATGTRLPGDPTSLEFRIALDKLNRAPLGDIPADRTFGHLVREYRQSTKYADISAATRSEYDRHLRYVEPVMRDWAVKDIRQAHIEKIMQKFLTKPTLRVAIKRTLSVLLSYAVRPLGWIDINPCFGMESARMRKQKELGQRPYEEEEIRKFRRANPYGLRARLAFEIALAGGFRRGDLTRIRADDIKEGVIHMFTNKAGTEVIVLVNDHIRLAWEAWEDARRKKGWPPSKYAICSEDGGQLHKRTLSKDISEACARAKFEPDRRLHALRYTAAVRLRETGHNLEDIADHVGHRMLSMAEKYVAKKRAAERRKQVLDQFDRAEAKGGDE